MIAAEADAFRIQVLMRRFFGARSVPDVGDLAYGGAVATMGASTRQALMMALLACETFDDETHTSGSFETGDYAAPYTVSFRIEGSTLTVSAVPL